MKIVFKQAIAVIALFGLANVFAATESKEKIEEISKLYETEETVIYEFFSLGCPACFATESFVKEWLKTKPENIKFEKIHVSYGNGSWKALAQAFYAAQKLGIERQAIDKIFNFVHVQKNRVGNVVQLAPIFEELGIDKQTFMKTANSFAVKSQLRKADNLASSLKSGGVPDFVINGRFRLNKGAYSSDEELKQALNTLPVTLKQAQ